MIRDIIVISNGLPLFTKHYTSSKNFFTDKDELILISGFLSALNSFSDQFEDLGNIRELKLSNTDLRLSFLKDSSIPNLIFLASFDNKSNSTEVEKFLINISKAFHKKYNNDKLRKWDGKMEDFESFEQEVNHYIKEEVNTRGENFKSRILNLVDVVEKTNTNEMQADNNSKLNEKKPKYNYYVPSLKISGNINPKHYLTGKDSIEVFHEIDGTRSIEIIAKNVNLSPQSVYNTCKNLIKLGFVSFQIPTTH